MASGVTFEPPNIGLQRTSACGLAAEAASFGGAIRLLLLVCCFTALMACRQHARWGSPTFDTEISRLLLANKCEKAVDLLLVADARADVHWYEQLILAKLDCLAKAGPRPGFGDDILAIVNDGIKRFPRSARLVFLKGFVNGRLGESGVELKYYQDAPDLANANISADIGGHGNIDDRRVAENARANLEAARKNHS